MSTLGTRRNHVGHLSRDEAFSLLANPRRRCVLHYLRRIEPSAELGDMAARIAAWENDTTVEQLSSSQRKTVYTSLQQTHLRKLDDAGIVEYDHDRGHIDATAATGELEVYLEIVPGREFPWREYYLALGAVSTALVMVAWQNLGPFGLLPDAAWAGLIAAALTLSAAAHVYHERNMRLGDGDRPADLDLDRT